MRTSARISWLLFACLSVPLHSSAQTQLSSNKNLVSVRELSIPPKALHAFDRGMELLAKSDPAGSLPHFQRAIAEFAGYYEAYSKMGVADLKLWRIADAEQAFRKSIELSGGRYAQPLFALGAILDDQEKFAEAEDVARKGLDLAPDAWRGHYYLGVALYGLNRLEEAEKSVREALRQKTDSAAALLLLADIHSREKNYRSLLNDLDDYLKLEPDSPASVRARAIRESVQRTFVASQTSTALSQSQP